MWLVVECLPLLHPPRAAAASSLTPCSWLPLVRSSTILLGVSVHRTMALLPQNTPGIGHLSFCFCARFAPQNYCKSAPWRALHAFSFTLMLGSTKCLLSCQRPHPFQHICSPASEVSLYSTPCLLPLDTRHVAQEPWPCCSNLVCACV